LCELDKMDVKSARLLLGWRSDKELRDLCEELQGQPFRWEYENRMLKAIRVLLVLRSRRVASK